MSATQVRPEVVVRPPAVTLYAWRCPCCGTILAKLALAPGSVVEIKCRRCNVTAVRESG